MPKKGESIYHRKDGLWEARYVKEIDANGKRKYGSVYARSYREVKEKRQVMLENIIIYQRPMVSYGNWTVGQIVQEWLYINQNRLKPSTYQRYVGIYNNHIKDVIGNQRILYLTTTILHDFASGRLRSGLAPQSVNAVLIFLHSCLKYGSRQYRLPLPEIVYLSHPKKKMRVLSREEEKRLVGYILQNMDVHMFGILLALYTGLRVGELCALQWSDIKDNCIHVNRTMQRISRTGERHTDLIVGAPKTASSVRCIPVPSFLIEYIERFRDETQQYVLGTRCKPVVEPRVMQYQFGQTTHKLGIERATFHTLRHTFATRCVEAGFEIKALSEILGHSSIKMTMDNYVHVSQEHIRENMERLVFAS